MSCFIPSQRQLRKLGLWGFRFGGLGFGVQGGSYCRVWGFRGLGFGVQGLGSKGFGFRAYVLGVFRL